MAPRSTLARTLLTVGLAITLLVGVVAASRAADPEDPCGHHLRDSTAASQRAYSSCQQGQRGGAGTAPAPAGGNAAARILGPAPSGRSWHSGVWLGGRFTPAALADFGVWRGRPTDVVTTYSAKSSYQAIMDEDWHITVWDGFDGRLNYGLAMVPEDGAGSLASVARGDQDPVWTAVAQKLVANRRGDSIIRAGWESNLPDWPWRVTATSAAEYKAAFRRVVTTMRAAAPDLVFEFGVACGSGLPGASDRLAALTEVYPGDDVVDLVGCDTYDWYDTQASNAKAWQSVLLPAKGPGIQDVADFARQRGKGASFAEWGLAKKGLRSNGGGDNPYYVQAMYNFFEANSDVVVFECYFDEPGSYIKNSLYGTSQNPKAAAAYRRLW